MSNGVLDSTITEREFRKRAAQEVYGGDHRTENVFLDDYYGINESVIYPTTEEDPKGLVDIICAFFGDLALLFSVYFCPVPKKQKYY